MDRNFTQSHFLNSKHMRDFGRTPVALGFPAGRNFLVLRDKGTEVPSLSQDKGTTGQWDNGTRSLLCSGTMGQWDKLRPGF